MLSRSILRGLEGEPLYYITQMEDITERKRAEHALRLSEAKFSGIVSIAAEAIISVDLKQRITIFNEGAERIFGYRKQEVIGSQLDRLIPERFRAKHNQDSRSSPRATKTRARWLSEWRCTVVGRTAKNSPAKRRSPR